MADEMEMYHDPGKSEASSMTPSEDSYFNRDKTLVLIELFKKYKPAMTKGDIKTMKEMWEIIATDLSNKFGLPITGPKCQNRFKVLERGYKKMLNDNEGGQRRKKVFPYAKEFKDIKPRKYEFVPGLVPPYNTSNTEKNDSSSTESAGEVNYETVYVTDGTYPQQANHLDDNQTHYVSTETETIGTAEITVQTSAQPKQTEMQWSSDDSYFNRERTLTLISLFKEYAPQVSMGAIKTKKEMWETIARHMSDQFNITITSSKCENRFKVLERNFKHLEFHNANRQNARLPFKKYEFERELREIFGDKFKNQLPPQKKEKVDPSTSSEPVEVNPPPFTIRVLEAQPIPIELPVPDKIERILLGIRGDLQYYNNERLKVEWRKLAVEEEKLKLNKRKLKLLEDQRKTES